MYAAKYPIPYLVEFSLFIAAASPVPTVTLVCHPIPRVGAMGLLASFGVNRLPRLGVMVLAEAPFGMAHGPQIESLVRIVAGEELQRLVRLAGLEIDGPPLSHLLETELRVGDSESVPGIPVRCDGERGVLVALLLAVAELHRAVLFTFAVGAGHAPPFLISLLLPEVSVFPVESQSEPGFFKDFVLLPQNQKACEYI